MTSSTPEPASSPETSSKDESTAADSPGSDSPGSDSTEDAAKRKFREALERKRGAQAAQHDDDVKGGGKVRDNHGPAARRRTFRRKSG